MKYSVSQPLPLMLVYSHKYVNYMNTYYCCLPSADCCWLQQSDKHKPEMKGPRLNTNHFILHYNIQTAKTRYSMNYCVLIAVWWNRIKIYQESLKKICLNLTISLIYSLILFLYTNINVNLWTSLCNRMQAS